METYHEALEPGKDLTDVLGQERLARRHEGFLAGDLCGDGERQHRRRRRFREAKRTLHSVGEVLQDLGDENEGAAGLRIQLGCERRD